VSAIVLHTDMQLIQAITAIRLGFSFCVKYIKYGQDACVAVITLPPQGGA